LVKTLPLKVTNWGLLEAPSVNVTVPVAVPIAVAVNVTPTVQLAPAAMLVPHVLLAIPKGLLTPILAKVSDTLK
jgi:hypothetical protein